MSTVTFRLQCLVLSSRRRHTMWPRDWSSGVCSSDLLRQCAVRVCAPRCFSDERSKAPGPAVARRLNRKHRGPHAVGRSEERRVGEARRRAEEKVKRKKKERKAKTEKTDEAASNASDT